jgi:AraC-like DNA-binding protein
MTPRDGGAIRVFHTTSRPSTTACLHGPFCWYYGHSQKRSPLGVKARTAALWQIEEDPASRGHVHRVAAGFGHALLAPLAAYIFKDLRISASVWEHGALWKPIYGAPTLALFELEHGVDFQRHLYNLRHLERVHRTKRPMRGELWGYWDFFVPILARGQVVGVLVTGPFATARPSGAEILARWFQLTGRQGHLSDAEFASYLAASLRILVLERKKLFSFEQLLVRLGRLMSGEGDAGNIINQIESLRGELEDVRLVEDTFDAVRQMVDGRSHHVWSSAAQRRYLKALGLSRPADHVLVGLGVNRRADADRIDEAVRRDAFQRATVDLARAFGDVIAGPVGEHGVMFLSAFRGAARKKDLRLRALAERVSALGRRFGLSIHFGADAGTPATPVSRSYESALGAAESALVRGVELIVPASGGGPSPGSLRHLRIDLAKDIEEHADLLPARFERLLEVVTTRMGYRVDLSRPYLEIAFDHVAERLLNSGALGPKSFQVMCEQLEREAGASRTVDELSAAYRKAIGELGDALKAPVLARQDRNLRGALEYIHLHFSENPSRAKVARVAGFAPRYFSRLFKKHEGKTFERYLHDLRIERSKQLLESSGLDAARIAELSGFRSASYFSRAFRRAVGHSPTSYREELAPPKPGSFDPIRVLRRRPSGPFRQGT